MEPCDLAKLVGKEVIVIGLHFSVRGILSQRFPSQLFQLYEENKFTVMFSEDNVAEIWNLYADTPWKIQLKKGE